MSILIKRWFERVVIRCYSFVEVCRVCHVIIKCLSYVFLCFLLISVIKSSKVFLIEGQNYRQVSTILMNKT
jgi:hypothetical protein